MTQIEKIDYMIQSLNLVKEELNYINKYKNKDHSYYDKDRLPSGTTVREALKMVGRLANQVANDCTLTPYCSEVWRNNE